MACRQAVFVVVVLGIAGCAATAPGAPSEDASFRVTADDAPEGYRLASFSPCVSSKCGDGWRPTENPTEVPPLESGRMLALVANMTEVPAKAELIVFEHQEEHTSLAVWTLTFASQQTAAGWRTQPGADWLLAINALCSGHARFGFVAGNVAVLLIGGGIGGDHEEPHVFQATLDLLDDLQSRANGTGICTEAELEIGRRDARTDQDRSWEPNNDLAHATDLSGPAASDVWGNCSAFPPETRTGIGSRSPQRPTSPGECTATRCVWDWTSLAPTVRCWQPARTRTRTTRMAVQRSASLSSQASTC